MRNKLYTALFSFITLCFFCYSCSKNNEDEEKPGEALFTFTIDPATPNFIHFSATGDNSNSIYEWKLSDDSKLSNLQNFVHYFEKKGIYEITLNQTVNGKKLTSTKTITISQDSYYYTQNEQLWWSDDFTSPTLDVNAWNYDQGTGIWGNNEWQTYTNKSDNSFVRDGKLILKAIKTGVGQKVGDYTSARLTTRGKKEISNGRVEVRARLAGGVGLWPAIWMYGTKASPYYSELDIMEYVGCDKEIIYGAIHTTETLEETQKASGSKSVKGVEENFHIYGMNWTSEKIEFYLDTPDNVYLTFSPQDKSNLRVWPFNKELYLILNIAVGGDWGGMKGVDDTIFPREMEIDYVRIFKKK